MAKSIMHNKKDGTCYLCMRINSDYSRKTVLEEHHAMPGTANRKLSEHYGLKVYLCPEHHRINQIAVHNCITTERYIQKKAQKVFEQKYSHELWMKEFGRNYL